MNMSLFQIIAAIFMVSTAIALVVTFRKYKDAASERRMVSMLEHVGLDPAVASSADTEAIMQEIRRRCRTCATEDVCERWLADDEDSDNVFCPNAKVLDALQRTNGWGCSSAGRASCSQREGQEFDPPRLHQLN